MLRFLNLSVVLLLFVAGCAPGSPSDAIMPRVSSRFIVYLLNETVNNTLIDEARNKAVYEIEKNAQPGDVWYVRAINEKSYNDEAAIMSLRCPAPLSASNSNPFDTEAKRRELTFQSKFASLRKAAAQKLRQRKVQPAPIADLWGALDKANDLFMNAPPSLEKVLIIVSDLEDNVDRPTNIDLRGVRIIVCLLSHSDAVRVHGRRSFWLGILKQAGAGPITVFDHTQTLTTDLLAIAAGSSN